MIAVDDNARESITLKKDHREKKDSIYFCDRQAWND